MRRWTVRFDGNTVRVGVRWQRELSALRRCDDFSMAGSLPTIEKSTHRVNTPVHLQTISAVHLQTISAKRRGGGYPTWHGQICLRPGPVRAARTMLPSAARSRAANISPGAGLPGPSRARAEAVPSG